MRGITMGDASPGLVARSKRLLGDGRAIGVIVALPVVVAAFSLIGRHWFPAGDQAQIVLHIGDVGGRHTPLVGVFSRFGFYHPGPLIFWVLAPFRLLGGATAVLLGAATINGAFLVGTVVVAHRRGGLVGALWVAIFVAVLCHALGPAILIDPWNPWLALTGFVLFMLLAWSVVCGDVALWPWLIGVGSWEVQTHLGYAPIVGCLLLFVIGLRVLLSRGIERVGRRHPIRRATAVVVVLWIAPLIQELTGHPGNLNAIATWAMNTKGPIVGIDQAVHIAGRQLAIPPPWIVGHDTTLINTLAAGRILPGLLQVLVLAFAGWVAWRRQQREAALLAGVCLAALLAGVLALYRVDGLAFFYLARWMWVIAMFVPLATGWCIASIVPWPLLLTRTSVTALAAATSAVVGLTAIHAATTPMPEQKLSDALATLVPTTQRSIDRTHSYTVLSVEPFLGWVGIGLDASLEARGYRVFLPPEFAFSAGSYRTTREPTDGILFVAALHKVRTGFLIPPGWVRVAHWDPLTESERAQANALEDSIRQIVGTDLTRTTEIAATTFGWSYVRAGAPKATVRQLAELQSRGEAYDVYLTSRP